MERLNKNPHLLVSENGKKIAIQYTNECIEIRANKYYIGTLDMAPELYTYVCCNNLDDLIKTRIAAHAAPPIYETQLCIHPDPRIAHNAITDNDIIQFYTANPQHILSLYKSYSNLLNIQRAGLIAPFILPVPTQQAPVTNQLGLIPIVEYDAAAPIIALPPPIFTTEQIDALKKYDISYMPNGHILRSTLYEMYCATAVRLNKKTVSLKLFQNIIESIITKLYVVKFEGGIYYKYITVEHLL